MLFTEREKGMEKQGELFSSPFMLMGGRYIHWIQLVTSYKR